MSEQMEAAGRGGGQVKRRAYLRYLLELRADESLADQLGIRTPHKTIDQIRQEFEKNHGSIYLELKNWRIEKLKNSCVPSVASGKAERKNWAIVINNLNF